MSDSGINRLFGSQVACRVVFVTIVGLVLYSLFLLGNNYYDPNNSILKNMVFRREKTIGMLMGK